MQRFLVAAACVVMGPIATASEVFMFSDPSGLGAEAEFTLLDEGMTLEIRFRNTSTGLPEGFESADQILTGLSWDFGAPGSNDEVEITGGLVMTGPDSMSISFDIIDVGSDAIVSGEWGFGNGGGSGALTNFISANGAQATPFGGDNLDGPENLDGPQGGLIGDPILLDLGGLGAVQDEVIATLTLSEAVDDLGFLDDNPVRVEFGSDAFFITIPEPASLGLMMAGALVVISGGWRRRS